jgi:hypothetical protein
MEFHETRSRVPSSNTLRPERQSPIEVEEPIPGEQIVIQTPPHGLGVQQCPDTADACLEHAGEGVGVGVHRGAWWSPGASSREARENFTGTTRPFNEHEVNP